MRHSADLRRWRDDLAHDMWPDDVPRPPVAASVGGRGVVSASSAIAGALEIVKALMGSGSQSRRRGMR